VAFALASGNEMAAMESREMGVLPGGVSQMAD
jgi:hypothetical protein